MTENIKYPASYVSRGGYVFNVTNRGLISNNVIIGETNDEDLQHFGNGVWCWRADGKWRWDELEHELDLINPVQS